MPTDKIALLCFVLAALAGGLAHATEESLDDAWRMALAGDPGLAAINEEVEAARAAERATRAQRLPTLGAQASYLRLADSPALSLAAPGMSIQSPRIFDNDDAVLGTAEIRLPLYTGGRLAAGIRAAGHERRAAEAARLQALADLKYDVAERFVGVLRTRAALTAATAQVAALEAHLRDVTLMVEQGAVNRSDLLASKVAFANAVQQRLRAETAVARARAEYNRRLGQPLEREPVMAPTIDSTIDLSDANLAVLQARAWRDRPELLGLAARSAAFGEQARAELRSRWPQWGLNVAYSHLENTVLDREDFSMIGLGVSWQLFDGGQARHRAAALRRASRAQDLRREDLHAAIGVEVQQSWLELAEARARVSATRDAVAQADENLRMSREQYAAELIPNTQVLDAVALQLSAAANARDAQLDEVLARLRLARAVAAL